MKHLSKSFLLMWLALAPLIHAGTTDGSCPKAELLALTQVPDAIPARMIVSTVKKALTSDRRLADIQAIVDILNIGGHQVLVLKTRTGTALTPDSRDLANRALTTALATIPGTDLRQPTRVEPNHAGRANATADSYYCAPGAMQDCLNDTPGLWGLNRIHAQSALARIGLLDDLPSVVVAVLDTGIDLSHPDLQFNLWSGPPPTGVGSIHGLNLTSNDLQAPASDLIQDTDGHGTNVTGVLVGRTDGGSSIASTESRKFLQFIPLKVMISSNHLCESKLIRGLITAYTYENGPDARLRVANISGSFPTEVPFLKLELDALESAAPKLLIVNAVTNKFSGTNNRLIAAPDNSSSNRDYPVLYQQTNVMTVTALDSDNEVTATYSRDLVDLAAPGDEIITTTLSSKKPDDPYGQGYAQEHGASLAAPLVAGTAALLSGLAPDWNAAQIREYILRMADTSQCATSLPVGQHDDNDDNVCAAVRGGGVLDLDAATAPPILGYQQDSVTKELSNAIKLSASTSDAVRRAGDSLTVSWTEHPQAMGFAPSMDLCSKLNVSVVTAKPSPGTQPDPQPPPRPNLGSAIPVSGSDIEVSKGSTTFDLPSPGTSGKTTAWIRLACPGTMLFRLSDPFELQSAAN